MSNLESVHNGCMILVDKPLGWTSFDVVKKLRANLRIKKIGHAGTLDPLATGLLILCTGKMTKKLEEYQNLEKEYRGVLVLGKTTPSVDLETKFDSESDFSQVSCSQVRSAARSLTGRIQQIPPSYSAIKVDGQRVYKKARRGETVVLKPREVEVMEFEITSCSLPQIEFKVVCSKGTYIRSLVRDLGEKLKVGAYLAQLSRTRIGPHLLSDAQTPESYINQISGISN